MGEFNWKSNFESLKANDAQAICQTLKVSGEMFTQLLLDVESEIVNDVPWNADLEVGFGRACGKTGSYCMVSRCEAECDCVLQAWLRQL